MNKVADNLEARLKNITLAVFDVDGILSNGQLLFLPNGQEVKQFNTLDGLGIKLLMQAGIETAIITGRSSNQVSLRSKSLGINYLYQGREDKLVALQELWSNSNHNAESTAYIGDDLPDLSAIRHCAFGATVPNAHSLVKTHADWCSERKGGEGAAREFCEYILNGQNKLEELHRQFM
ncbi:KdsC family phosphatase [Neptuniibacter caesariensis]|uniref:3-deoxy-D-manno-octulosonate 8-phosphate phosphatase KdsC n=1 Tax=Neptuniibacter caesariensis TaxID=207954 RepID=A0A7U8C4H3_NEPCE|nr:HAD hydrolase family protein [Neptuniibacter caesariensis]EAR61064.1 3-deoxy-D-manno-octulosonate 8-phosphate phosphatase [Neptuniibacter caesariensis]